jgi:N-acetylmuramic acid 6-phosphate etherase
MTNVQTRNAKLRERALRILMVETGIDEERAREIMHSADGDLPVALVMSKAGCSRDEAASALQKSRGVIAEAIALVRMPR